MTRPVIFGEVLFDHFPDGRRVLGGAPFNVAWHLQALGSEPRFISRVGKDVAGQEILEAMSAWSMDTRGVQTDPELPTGQVSVRFTKGEPEYQIVHPSAWDAIEAGIAVPPGGLLYHGSLALRDSASRSTLAQLRESPGISVFVDVNLRPPWWDRESIAAHLKKAHWVKLNEDELERLGFAKGTLRERTKAYIEEHGLRGLIVTRGAAGAVIVGADGDVAAGAFEGSVPIKDTVGAGDAFSSIVILGLARSWPADVILKRALDFAAHICGRHGATVADADFYAPFIKDWKLQEEIARDV